MYDFPQIKYNVYYAKLLDIKIKFIRSNCQNCNGEGGETKETEKEEKNEEIELSKEERKKGRGRWRRIEAEGRKGRHMVEWGVKKEWNEREAVTFAYFNLIPGSHEICIPYLIITQF